MSARSIQESHAVAQIVCVCERESDRQTDRQTEKRKTETGVPEELKETKKKVSPVTHT